MIYFFNFKRKYFFSLLLFLLVFFMFSANINNINADVQEKTSVTTVTEDSIVTEDSPTNMLPDQVHGEKGEGADIQRYQNPPPNQKDSHESSSSREIHSEDRNTITTLRSIYEQAGLPLNDQISGVLVKVEDDSIQLTIGFHKSHQFTSELYEEHFIMSNGDLHHVLDRLNAIVVKVPISSLKNFMEYWKALSNVRYVEAAQVTQVSAVPNDPDWSLQYGPQIIQADLAWDIQMGDPASILVAVIDTGIDYNHPDLADQYVPIGFDWVFDDNDPMDDHSHGTHCAGTIAAT
ncbi:MAG: S8 family serine peptidase, partial [Candidatus Hermodarchaeota archaeon]